MRLHPNAYVGLNTIGMDAWDVAEESGWHARLPVPNYPMVTSEYVEFYGAERVLANLALIHSEASEAVEAVRKAPEHIGEELADVLIRTLELAHMLGIDIGHLTEAKMRRNRVRADVPARAGGKAI